MYQLFIYLQPAGGLVWLWQRRADGAVQQRGHADSLAQLMLPAHLRPQDAVLVLPAEWVLIKQCLLPKGAKASALPLLLESELFVDIDQQHWQDCTGKGKQRTVAMVDRHQLEQWRDALLDHGLAVRSIVPDCWLLPDNGGISVLQQHDRLLVRGADKQGWAIDTQLTPQLIAQLPEINNAHEAPAVTLYGYGLDSAQQQQWQCEGVPLPDDPVAWLTRRWRDEPGLIPESWQGKPAAEQLQVNWKTPAVLAALCGVLLLGWLWLDGQQQRNEAELAQQQLQQLLQRQPSLKPGPGLEEQLLDLRLAQQQRQQLAKQLDQIAQVLRVVPTRQLSAMQLKNGQITLSFTGVSKGLNDSQQQQLQQMVVQQGYQLQWRQPGRQLVLLPTQLQAGNQSEEGAHAE